MSILRDIEKSLIAGSITHEQRTALWAALCSKEQKKSAKAKAIILQYAKLKNIAYWHLLDLIGTHDTQSCKAPEKLRAIRLFKNLDFIKAISPFHYWQDSLTRIIAAHRKVVDCPHCQSIGNARASFSVLAYHHEYSDLLREMDLSRYLKTPAVGSGLFKLAKKDFYYGKISFNALREQFSQLKLPAKKAALQLLITVCQERGCRQDDVDKMPIHEMAYNGDATPGFKFAEPLLEDQGLCDLATELVCELSKYDDRYTLTVKYITEGQYPSISMETRAKAIAAYWGAMLVPVTIVGSAHKRLAHSEVEDAASFFIRGWDEYFHRLQQESDPVVLKNMLPPLSNMVWLYGQKNNKSSQGELLNVLLRLLRSYSKNVRRAAINALEAYISAATDQQKTNIRAALKNQEHSESDLGNLQIMLRLRIYVLG